MAQRGTASVQEQALSMFERPTEPVFIPKGEKNIVFDVPNDYLVKFFFILYIFFSYDLKY
jgi:ethanolamine utilization protein EutQ (cupin superfamily)